MKILLVAVPTKLISFPSPSLVFGKLLAAVCKQSLFLCLKEYYRRPQEED